MRKNVFAGSMLLLACVALVACTTDSGEEVQYVKIGQNLCSFLAEGNQPLEIDVKASPAEWTVEAGATWVKAERTDGRTLTVTVDDNNTGAERSTTISIAADQASQEIRVNQLAKDNEFARYRKLDYLSKSGAMSPSGRYVGGYVATVGDDDVWLKSPTIIDLETDEVYEFGPYPETLYFMTQTICISDQGLLFIKDGNQGGMFVCDLEGNITKLEEVEGLSSGSPTVEATSADGKYWVGYAKEQNGGLYRPLLWTDGVPEVLPMPEKGFRNQEFTTGVMARGISANGEIIYGTSWENSDFGMCYWVNNGANTEKPQWVGKDVREVGVVKKTKDDGTEYDYTCVNGIICQAWNTQISPSGKWIAGRYRREFDPETKQALELKEQYAAFYNTETEKTVIVKDYGESSGQFVTDDGIGFIGIGTLGISSGAVYDLNTGTDLGSPQDWIYDNYGIITTTGYVTYVSADGKYVLGTLAQAASIVGTKFISWYIAPPLEE